MRHRPDTVVLCLSETYHDYYSFSKDMYSWQFMATLWPSTQTVKQILSMVGAKSSGEGGSCLAFRGKRKLDVSEALEDVTPSTAGPFQWSDIQILSKTPVVLTFSFA